jgi:hypothetical protein
MLRKIVDWFFKKDEVNNGMTDVTYTKPITKIFKKEVGYEPKTFTRKQWQRIKCLRKISSKSRMVNLRNM